VALQTEFKKQGDFLFKYRSYFPLLFLVIGLAVSLYGEYLKTKSIETIDSEYYEFIALGVCFLGLILRVKTVGHTPKHTSGRNTTEGQLAKQLNTTGMYSLVRHPLYLGNFFMWLGVALLTENLWFIIAFILLYCLYYERIMYAEESFLISKFGNEYIEWSKATPAFIPSFKHYKKAKYPFCIGKVLKKEKNGLAAIFLLFWLFECAGDLIEYKSLKIEFDFWFYGAVIGTILYFILKIMKKQHVFKETNL